MFQALKSWLQARRERRAVESVLSVLVSRKVSKLILKDRDVFLEGGKMPLDPKRIELALISISTIDVDTYSKHCEALLDLAEKHGALVNAVMPTMLVLFGCLGESPSGACVRFVEDARSQFSESVAIVHGATTAQMGSFGNSQRMTWGLWWPGMNDALRVLASLKPGEVREILEETASL